MSKVTEYKGSVSEEEVKAFFDSIPYTAENICIEFLTKRLKEGRHRQLLRGNIEAMLENAL